MRVLDLGEENLVPLPFKEAELQGIHGEVQLPGVKYTWPSHPYQAHRMGVNL